MKTGEVVPTCHSHCHLWGGRRERRREGEGEREMRWRGCRHCCRRCCCSHCRSHHHPGLVKKRQGRTWRPHRSHTRRSHPRSLIPTAVIAVITDTAATIGIAGAGAAAA